MDERFTTRWLAARRSSSTSADGNNTHVGPRRERSPLSRALAQSSNLVGLDMDVREIQQRAA